MIGWVAVSMSDLWTMGLAMAGLVFIWIPMHIWALTLHFKEDYGLRNLGIAFSVMKCKIIHIDSMTLGLQEIMQIKGIGPWTANYIAMRAFGEPDAFIAHDLGIIKALTPKGGTRPTANQVEKRAENWRPWRAYAAIYLWHTL